MNGKPTHKVFEIDIRIDAFLLSETICEIISSTVHTTSEKFEKGVFTPKTHQMFFVHSKLEELKNATIAAHFGFCV